MGYKAALLSLGCKVNSYETEKIREDLVEKNFEIVGFDEIADVYIVNTCSVTNIADRKSRQMLHKASAMNPLAIIVATGCYVQTEEKDEKLKEAADIVVGNNHKGEIADVIISYLDEEKKKYTVTDPEEKNNKHSGNGSKDDSFTKSILDDISCEKEVENFSINDYPERSRAFVRIEDGCNQFCSYCIIPYARGRVRSRSENEILDEVRSLAQKGFKEVVLTGIHISSYGVDNYEKMLKTKQKSNEAVDNAVSIPKREDQNGIVFNFDSTPLLKLIRKISFVDGIERIRLSSLEPRIITEEFVESLKDIPAFCPHFHLSLQSGCNSVLKRMNRHYSAEEYLEKCRIIRECFDRAAITTDVIVGFPMESDEEFEESYTMCQEAAFAKMHIFKYSRRKGTVADRMTGQLTEKEKHQRSLKMQELDEEMQEKYINSFLGDTVRILVEEEVDGFYQGLTERYVQVRFKAEAQGLINSIVPVRITGISQKGVLMGVLEN